MAHVTIWTSPTSPN